MRTIERSSGFRKDYKRESKSGQKLDEVLIPVLQNLAADRLLEPRHRDHVLSGDWIGYRECHLKPDLLLIYCKVDSGILRLARLGSHSELFG